MNEKGRQLEYICTVGMGKMFHAQGYVVINSVMVSCM
jgi:hypothetical protein